MLEVMEAGAAYRPNSVDAPGGSGGPNDRLERERTIVYLRYFEGLTRAEIAARVGVSQVHVSRLLHKALHTLGDLV